MASEVPSLYTVSLICLRHLFTIANSIVDPNDPLRDLYDVDDENTIITLSDWYHVLAPEGTNQFFSSGIVPYVVNFEVWRLLMDGLTGFPILA